MSVNVTRLVQDIRFAARQMRRTKLFTGMIVGVLALGIGGNAALLMLFDALTTRPAPGIAVDDRVVRLRGAEMNELGSRLARALTADEVAAYAGRRDVFSRVAAWTSEDAFVDAGTGPAPAPVEFVSASYFPVLGVRPAVGTGLPADVDAAPVLVAVVSHAYWQSALGGVPDVVGRTLRVNDVSVTVVGVAPPRFDGVDRKASAAGR